MDNRSKPDVDNTDHRTPLGIGSFGQQEREQFGQSIRLAMECIDATSEPAEGKAIPLDEITVRQRLKALSQEITSNHADLLELLVRFDDLEGWKASGARYCAAWMNLEIGVGIQSGWEYLRVGRKLRTLSTLRALFRAGKLSWSKVRLISRVADADNEKCLCHAALDASVSDVKRLCAGFRWQEDDNGEAENDRALQQLASRALTWSESGNGNTRIQLTLPPETAQAFLNSVEYSLSQLDDTKEPKDDASSTISQRRADATVLMAETSLHNAGRDIVTADRYQVIVSVDASALTKGGDDSNIPSKRPSIKGSGPVARETARRIACDCSLTINKTVNGEPVDIGRKSRIWPNAMARAIRERDQHCVWPGCTQTQHLHIHHLQHWADGGATSVQNSACLCSAHHTLVHEGGYTIQRVEDNEQRLYEQFVEQQHTADIGQFDVEKELRNDHDSFKTVRKLSPDNYRFRIVDAQGQNINNCSDADSSDIRTDSTVGFDEYTRVGCGEQPAPDYYHGRIRDRHAFLHTSEAAASYSIH
ncbi:DUF222 domain-containing protein [Granulosicoccus antarcticus]|uniref:HNH nuclease domain-containing protein n=1 Tax=Granulosicoccus antarcticus IMCC3135 TaxID=1192854 RepID=A0A2Z2NSN0_9GAMM|nr:DUF222 domain-containing protein [Granulosicoccus antarcticus]ASJ74309.1 hypothetical protein IMCC3135_21160 [Granulosicoccus antarcticus IMCC3135]